MRKLRLTLPFSILLSLFLAPDHLAGQQVSIPRIEEMPAFPQPYIMREWKQVALGYDSLVYDLGASGEYFPLTALYSSTRNYPEHGNFHQVTYVGQNLTHNEAINSMMGVIGASLCGIDKSDQEGVNWVLMLEEFFNKQNGQNVFLNNPATKTGNDWWYETIPNVLFYQLFSLYPDEAHFAEQFLVVADRWLEAVENMGADDGPWSIPYMNYRAYNLETMEPRTDGVPEPEAAGAIGWLLYMAYEQSGLDKYRIGAELCMEYFDGLEESPVYELQYLYGTILAARMNGELGTSYDLEKIMNWNFDVGPLRVWAHTTGWGVTVGNWNGLDVSGLTGAISVPENTDFGDYAFAMNSFQQAGILTPLVRYDDRYARAMGRYLLNMANSARLFYPDFLPDENQDGAEWSHQYDPDSYIAYEAIRRYKDDKSPFATGDAMKGGWAPTNHSLYSSSPVGYLASIIDTTNIEGILKFDLLKTDFFHQAAYPSFLLYNPHSDVQRIDLDVGPDAVDIYDAVSSSFIQKNVTNQTQIPIPGDEALVIVLVPEGASIAQDGNHTLADGIIIDYQPEIQVPKPLRMKALAAEESTITEATEFVNIYCTADYYLPEALDYSWFFNGSGVGDNSNLLTWNSPREPGKYWITCTVSNRTDQQVSDSVQVEIVAFINTPPKLDYITIDPSRIETGDTAHLFCLATDPDEEILSFAWSSAGGSFDDPAAESVTWTAPSAQGDYYLVCNVTDEHNGRDSDSILARVIEQGAHQTGNLIAHYPFNYDVEDYSGNDNHGTKHNVTFINVRDAAYYFNGFNSYVEVPSSAELNCNDAISVSFWMKPTQLYDRETYPISHGLWHERWKISVTENKVRWTVRTVDNGSEVISDLDSRTSIELNRLYQVVGTYDGKYTDLYINAGFEGLLSQEGTIENSSVPMTIGQASPTATANNFKGVLDEIRIHDYALSHEEIKAAYAEDLLALQEVLLSENNTLSIYPNPFEDELWISYHLNDASNVRIEVYDLVSRKVKTIFHGRQLPGVHKHIWDGRDAQGSLLEKGIYFCALYTDKQVYTITTIHK